MNPEDSAAAVSDLLSRLPGAALNSWTNPGRHSSAPFEYVINITTPHALAILAEVAHSANVPLKVIVATELNKRFDDPQRVRYLLSVPQEPIVPGHASPVEYAGSVLACRLRACGLIAQNEVDRLLATWKTTIPTVDELVHLLDRKPPGDLLEHWALHGFESLIPGLIAAFPRVRKWEGRNTILFELIRYARKYPEVVDLAVVALNDSASMVRMQACAILAYSLREDCIPNLESMLKHGNKKTRDYAAAAIDAIKHQNHWLDLEHAGSSKWIVNPQDEE